MLIDLLHWPTGLLDPSDLEFIEKTIKNGETVCQGLRQQR